MNNFNHLHQRIFSNNADLFSPLIKCIQNVTKIKGKLWRIFLVMLRNRMQTRNYRFVWGIFCSSCRCASSQWRHSWKIWIFALKPCLLFSTLLMTFADSHHWLHCQKSGIKNDGWGPPFFDNEDTLVRWVWRHWKSYHKHFFSKQKWIKCVYPDSFCTIYRLQKQFPFRKCKIL